MSSFKPYKETPTFMKLGVLLVPELSTETNFKLARQAGATDVVLPCPGFTLEALKAEIDRIKATGLNVSVIERFVPHDKLVHGLPGKEEQLENIKKLIVHMGKCGVKTFCYNWMPNDDWTRTSTTEQERGGALSTSFDISKQPQRLAGQTLQQDLISEEALWQNLKDFLTEVLPVCEANNVDLALHPDDPPTSTLANGQKQIVYDIDRIEKVTNLVQSERNGVCFCQGTFASRGIDIPSAIRRLNKKIKFVHARNVVCEDEGTGCKFRETWQDNGDIDYVEAMKAYKEVGFDGVIRPDHVPSMAGEDNSIPGYHMLGRLYALGYLKGLMEAVGKSL